MTKREQFLKYMEPFFETGAINEVFSNDNISIINMANYMYLATVYQPDALGKQFALMVDVERAQSMIEDYRNFAEYFQYLGDQGIKKSCITFNENTYKQMQILKRQTDISGPSEFVNINWENSMKQKSK